MRCIAFSSYFNLILLVPTALEPIKFPMKAQNLPCTVAGFSAMQSREDHHVQKPRGSSKSCLLFLALLQGLMSYSRRALVERSFALLLGTWNDKRSLMETWCMWSSGGIARFSCWRGRRPCQCECSANVNDLHMSFET